jgi:NADPH-dependent curcumin reductase CurA
LINKQLLLRKRPNGLPDEDTWELVEAKVPSLEDGQILVRNHYISLDPAMRGWLNDARSYIPPVQIGEVMRAGSVGEVIESRHDAFKAGDFVCGSGGVQHFSVTEGKGWYAVDPALASLPAYTGTLGMPGFTAFFGLLDVGKIKEGDTVLVSGAAGAVGSIVGQIAKIKGCRAVGIAGGDKKCRYIVEELGFDGAIDYKGENLYAAIKRECPRGVDVYFDNVGGDILDAALVQINMHARIVICGAISQYNNTTAVEGPKNYLSLLINRAKMEGFIVFDYANRYGEAAAQLGRWMAEGKIKSREDVHEGIENFTTTFQRLFSGEKLGKLVLKVI